MSFLTKYRVPGFFGLLAFVALTPYASAQVCTADSNSSYVVQQRNKLNTKLRVATFHADLPLMDSHYNTQTQFIESCKSPGRPVWQYCDSNCFHERGQYWLFKASELPLLAPGGRLLETPNSAMILQAAEEGIKVIEEGRKHLFAEINVAAAQGDASEQKTEQPFNTYLKKDLAFAVLLARFHMLVADNHYQAASSETAASLDRMVGELIPKEAGAETANNCSSRYCDAKARYEKAQWVLLEAKGSLPRNSPDFADQANLLRTVESDLQVRLNSIYSGQLFLGVDPYGFSKIGTQNLVNVLKELGERISQVEANVQNITKSWQEIKKAEEAEGTQEERYLSNEQINLKLFQIATLEQSAKTFADNVKGELDKLTMDEKSYGYRKQIREAEFQIKQSIKKSEFEQDQAKSRSEQEMLALEMQQAMDMRGELRWQINYQISVTSLQNQILALEAQLTEYDQRLTVVRNEKAALQNRKSQNDLDLGDGKGGSRGNINIQIASLDKDIEQLRKEKEELYWIKRSIKRTAICQVERELAFAGSPIGTPYQPTAEAAEKGDKACDVTAATGSGFNRAQYNQLICQARTNLISSQVRADFYIRKCLVGLKADDFPVSNEHQAKLKAEYNAIQCSNDTTSLALAQQIKLKRDAVNKDRLQEFNVAKTNLAAAMVFAETETGRVAALNATRTGLSSMIVAAQAAVNIPDTGTAGLGPYSVVSIREAALANLQVAYTAFKSAEDGSRTSSEVAKLVLEVSSNIKEAAAQLETLKDSQALDELIAQQSILEITQQGANHYFNAQQSYLQGVIQNIECDNLQASLEAEVDRLRAEHSKALLDMTASDGQNAMLAAKIARLENEKAILDNRRASIELENANLDLQIASENGELQTLDKLKIFVQSQRDNIAGTLGFIQEKEAQAAQITNDIASMFSKRFKQILENAQVTVEHLKGILQGEKTEAEKSMADLEKRIGAVQEEGSLLSAVTENQKQINEQIKTLRNEIKKGAGLLAESSASRPSTENRYLQTSEVLAALTLGIPDYLKQKKNYLASVNYVLGHLRSRARITGVITSSQAVELPVYVNNAFDVENLVRDLCTKSDRGCTPSPNSKFFDQQEVSIRTTEIIVPGHSGLLRSLNDGKPVYFDVNAGVQDEEDMRSRGYFTLGIPPARHSNRRDLYLMDVKIMGQFSCKSNRVTPQDFALEHTGIGYVITKDQPGSSGELPEANFVVTPPRSSRILAYNWNASIDENEFQAIDRKWSEHFTAATLPEYDLMSSIGQDSVLPFMGAPVFGRYKIQKISSDCEVSKLALKFIHNVNR